MTDLWYWCNAVARPYYWFPYGFERDSDIPVYHELYPDALREVSDRVSGYLYEVEADESQIISFKNIPCARLATEPIAVTNCIPVPNAYELFLAYGKQELSRWYSYIADYLTEKDMHKTPDCSYALFIKEKFPQVWEQYTGYTRKMKQEGNPGSQYAVITESALPPFMSIHRQ